MEDVVDALHRAFSDARLREIAFEKFDARNVRDVAALAGNQAVDDADPVAAANELFREVRSDETSAAGDEIERHRDQGRIGRRAGRVKGCRTERTVVRDVRRRRSCRRSLSLRRCTMRVDRSKPDDRWRFTHQRKVRTPQGSAPGNARSGQPEGQWHRKYTARLRARARAAGPQGPACAAGRRAMASKGEKVR